MKKQVASSMTKAKLLVELQKKEELLRQWKEGYRALLEESRDVVFTVKLNGPWVEVNPAGVTLFKYDSVEDLLRADTTHNLYVDSDEREKLEIKLVEKGHVKDVEIAMRRKNGERLMVQMSATAIRDERGNVVAY